MMVPLEIAVETEFVKSDLYFLGNLAMDIIFFLDILVVFNTSFEVNYEEIRERRMIVARYLKGQFTIDLLSALPVDLIASLIFEGLNPKQLKILSLFKLIRMLRLSKVVQMLPARTDNKSTIKIIILLIKVFVYLHCSACLQLYLLGYEALWDDPIYSQNMWWQARFFEDTTLH